METAENDEEIVLRHKPVKQWIFGGIFLLLFLSVYSFLIFYWLAVEKTWNVLIMLGVPLLGVVLLYLIFSGISAPLMIVVINRETKSVDVTRRRFYGTRTERFYFHQISRFKSYKAAKKTPPYFLALVLANRKTNKLNFPLGEKKANSRLIRRLNQFIKASRI